MNRLAKYRKQHAETRELMGAILTAAEATDGVLTDAQQKDYDGHKAKLATVEASIARENELAEAERRMPAVASHEPLITVEARAEKDPARGFSHTKEFFSSVLANRGATDRADVTDERLRPLAIMDKDDKKAGGELAFLLPAAYTPKTLQAAVGADEQGEYDERYGGFGVTRTRLPGILEVGFEGDPTAGMTQPIPMATPMVEIMARTDKDHTTSVSGGLTVARRAEAAAAAAARGQIEMITMKAASLFGLNYTTEELLADSPQTVVAIVDAGFRLQFGAHMLNEKLRGLGGDQYDGVIATAPCTVSQTKETGQSAATINFQNVIKMASRCWGYGSAVWLANHDTKPQLAVLALPIGTGGVPMYVPSSASGFPDMLWGRPIFYTEFAATIGTVGDLILGNWSQYLEGIYQPLQSAESIHVRFVNHERAFKFWLRNAGAPWWRSALTPNKSSSTLSPFVTLATRS